MKLNHWLNIVRLTILLGLPLLIGNEIDAQALVPGTGTQVPEVGDDFEDPTWEYQLSLPKVFNHGETTVSNNLPGGAALNGRWYEGSKRGQPDTMRRVVTPAGGLSGSTTALALRSLQTGSNRPTFQQQQDDLIASVSNRVGKISVSQSTSVVTRVWFPPVDQWERCLLALNHRQAALETCLHYLHPPSRDTSRAEQPDDVTHFEGTTAPHKNTAQ